MNTLVRLAGLILLLTGALVLPAYAEGCKDAPSALTASKEFEKIKLLAGHWEGTNNESGKKEKIETIYQVTSGGTAVIETLFPGTQHEMVSVFHDENGKLVMTHYCMLGNQPKMALSEATSNGLTLTLANEQKVIDPKKGIHMHALTLEMANSDSLSEKWSTLKDGEAQGESSLLFKRTK